ncbi:DUF421 domain-containing protein [Actinoallomurus rhizosphaericola]|uniref:DUF421 domain-containing protein n=1 Tax=Actinoallomurus rhizosphaericola TaxID=2952536 RepID=UPI0020928F48|nr:YetF domain-containing protein [Actinoallomurus rhizosphaericola]MCO5996716.1 DUF421 domain-containing protein [Actinoallomurus rhizosphaericola]
MEKLLRTVLVYIGLAVLLRLGGKRDLAQLNSFDLVVMLLLSNVVQNAVIGNDNSLTGGLLGAAVLVVINSLMVRLVNRHPRLVRLFEGRPTTVIRDGQVVSKALRRLGLRRSDVVAACRRQGADNISEIADATLSPGGALVVTLDEDHHDATIGDLRRENDRLLAQIRAELADLERRLTPPPA